MIPLNQNSAIISPTISIPQNNVDSVDTASVQPSYQSLLNNDFYIARAGFGKHQNIQVTSTNGTSARIFEFFGMWIPTANVVDLSTANWVAVSNPTSQTISVANLDVGGVFTTGQPYYIYAKYFSPGQVRFECSAQQPATTAHLFKGPTMTPDYSRIYIGSFMADSPTTMIPFFMRNFDYTMKCYFTTAFDTLTMAGPPPTYDTATWSLAGYIPPTAAIAKLAPAIAIAGDPSLCYFNLGPTSVPDWIHIVIGQPNETNRIISPVYECPVPGLAFQTQIANGNGTTSVGYSITITGYKE